MTTPSKIITIRRASANDAAAAAAIATNDAVYPGTLQQPYADEELWRERLATSKDSISLVAEINGTLAGVGSLHIDKRPRRNHAAGLGIHVKAELQKQGVGTALMQALLDYADNWTHLSRIELTVFADNAHAVRLYERFGFVTEGRHINYALRAGKLVDAICMARLKATRE